MGSERTSFVIRLLRGATELGADVSANLAATAAERGNSQLFTGAMACAALFIAAKTALGASEEKKTQQRVEERLRARFAESQDLQKTITALAAEQDMHALVSQKGADKLLTLLACQEDRLDELVAGDDDLRSLLQYVGNWLGKWCTRHQVKFAEFESRFDEFARENLAALRRIEDKVDSLAGQARAPAVQPLHQLRPPVGDFTGRKAEIDELLGKLQSGGVTITGVQGLGGIGKTELAYALAARLNGQYPDAQIYLDLRGTDATPAVAADALRHVILSFEPEAKLPDDVSQLQGLYQSVLREKRVLLLMDNARGAEQLLPLVPPPAGCVLLVTSRQHFALPGSYVKDLATLSPADAHALLLHICPRIGDAAKRIAELCGHLPLALRAVASLLNVQADLAAATYMDDLANEHTRLETIGTEGVPIGVAAALHQSYRRLDDDQARVFRVLSVFPGTFDGPAAELVAEDAKHRRLSTLVRHSLVEFDETTQRYRLHDLVRIYAGQQLVGDELRAAQHRHAAHYCGVARAADGLYLTGGEGVTKGLTLFDLEWSNIAAGFAWAEANATSDDEAARLCSDYPYVGVYCLDLRQHPRGKIAWREAGLSAAQHLHDKVAEAVHIGNLGIAYADLGEPRRAIEFYERALPIHREYGGQRAEGALLGDLANAYAALGEPRRAIEFYKQSLNVHRAIGDRRGQGATLNNLGSAFAELGEPRRAIEFHEQALAICREVGDRRAEGGALGNLGSAYYAVGEIGRTIELCEQYLVIAREIGDRRGEGNALGNLGNAHRRLGEPRRAVEFYEQALAIAREIGDAQGEGATLGSLGNTYADLGEPHRAIVYFEQCAEVHREIGDRRGEGNACWNAGLAYETLGDLPRAVELMQVCVDYDREIGHPAAEKGAAHVAELRERLKA